MALQIMTRLEVPEHEGSLCATDDCLNSGTFLCEDCDIQTPLCNTCILKCHLYLPLHRPMRWNGSFFERISLKDIGKVWHVSHGGKACPYVDNNNGIQELTIVDTTGIHNVCIGYCRCWNSVGFAEQLLYAKLFPASLQRPKTAFTFRVLRLFHILNLIAHITSWDFSGTMKRVTDNVDMKSPPVYHLIVAIQL